MTSTPLKKLIFSSAHNPVSGTSSAAALAKAGLAAEAFYEVKCEGGLFFILFSHLDKLFFSLPFLICKLSCQLISLTIKSPYDSYYFHRDILHNNYFLLWTNASRNESRGRRKL